MTPMNPCLDDLPLDSPNADQRAAAVQQATERLRTRPAIPATAKPRVNLHCHSFYSFNAWGWSPSGIAARCRAEGLEAAGLVDFDVLDGVDEFLNASACLGLRASAGIESRVYVPEFAMRVINSPGEPGIAYSMGMGFPSSDPGSDFHPFMKRLRQIPDDRNRKVVEAVNRYLSPVALNYERDVIPLTPAGNATERHLCLAYARRAAAVYADRNALARFWSSKLKHTITAAAATSPRIPDRSPLRRSSGISCAGGEACRRWPGWMDHPTARPPPTNGLTCAPPAAPAPSI